MREIDLLLREFLLTSFKQLGSEDLLTFDEVLNYDDQTLFDFIFKNESLGNESHEAFIKNSLNKRSISLIPLLHFHCNLFISAVIG